MSEGWKLIWFCTAVAMASALLLPWAIVAWVRYAMWVAGQ